MRFFHRLMGWAVTGGLMALAAVAAAASEPSGRLLSSDIPQEPLPRALAAFADQTGLQLVYLSSLAEGRLSAPAAAGSSPAEALAHLLAGTGIDFAFLNERTVKLFEAVQAPGERPAARAPPPLAALEEVVVTANKRTEYLRDVPVSATVFTGEDLSAAGATHFADIAMMTPGVEFDFNAQWGGGVLTNVAIRGIDSKVGASTTGIYIDDAPIQARNGNFGNPFPAIFDLARVEVLRGPQGTLFGAGAEGGAIRFITNEASTTTFSASSRVEFSSTEFGAPSYEAGSAVGGPLIDNALGARLSVWYRDDGGYIDRVDPLTGALVDKNANEARTEAFRLSFAFKPAEELQITPSLAYQSQRTADTSSFYEYLSDPDAGVLKNGKLLSQPSDDRFTLAATRLEYRWADLNLTAAFAYFDRTATATIDTTNEAGAVFFGGFGSPLGPAYPTSYADAVPSLTSLRQIVLSQEVRLSSLDNEAPLRWTAGLFYSRARQDEREYTYPIATPANPGVYSNEDNTDILVSGFGNVELAFAPGWRARLGVRLDEARSEFWQFSGGFAQAGTPAFLTADIDQKPVTPQFNVQYQSADQALLYATIAKGFRIGGVNSALPSQCEQQDAPPTYASDSVWSYEVGTKRRAFDERLQVVASAFYLRWDNIQEHEVPPCGFGYVANAGAAIGKGFDLAVDAALTDRLTTGLSLESIDVRYDQTVLIDGKVIVDRGSVVGGVPHVPAPWNGTLYLRYQERITGNLEGYARAESFIHSHNPGPFSELDPRSISYSPHYTADPATAQLNLNVGLAWPQWNVKLFADNALNSLPVLQRNADAGSSSLIYAYTYRPRTIGLTGTWTF